MSMNLECDGLTLYQTPTYVTNMIMVDKHNKVRWLLKGKAARKGLYQYIQYANSTIDGVWNDPIKLDLARAALNDHIKEVKQFIKDNGTCLELHKV